MTFITTNAVAGRRVRVVACSNPYTQIEPGAEGTIAYVDRMGTVHVHWDDGRRRGLIAEDGDCWELLP